MSDIRPGDLCTLDVGPVIVKVRPASRVTVRKDGTWHSPGESAPGQIWRDDVMFVVAMTHKGINSGALHNPAVYVIGPEAIGWFNGGVLVRA